MTMRHFTILAVFLFSASSGKAWSDSGTFSRKGKDPYPAYSNEFFLAGGYTHAHYNFFDAGLRYYHWRNDGQTIMAFAGASAGCEFSLKQPEKIYIPYIGWQGQYLGLGYGIRAEYGIRNNDRFIGCTPELGLSIFEMLRITGGYRFNFYHDEGFNFSGWRFSLVLAFPVSLMEGNGDDD